MLKSQGWLRLAVIGLAVTLAGCALEDGVKDGLNEGTSNALAALIEAPVQAILDRIFGT